MRGFTLLTASLLLSISAVSAQDNSNWPRWRGPHDNGSTEAAGAYPTNWDANSNLLWKVQLPGKGCSTPIVWNHQIFVTAPTNGLDALLAFDWSGKPLWQISFGTEKPGKHQNGSGCNPSPATDGQTVFVAFKSGTLAAVDLKGKLRWKADLSQYGKDTLYWDFGSSPVLTEKNVVMALLREGGSYLVAFDKLTGEVRWKVSRDFKTALEGDHCYATPIVFHEQGKERLLVFGGEHLTAHDAADGTMLWSAGDFNTKSVQYWPTVASPIIVKEIAVVPYARGKLLFGIKLGGSGDVTTTNRIWKREGTGTFVPTPAEYKGNVYLLRDEGQIECIEPATGKTLWKDALPKDSVNYYSSPAIADGKLYAIREDGVIYVARIEGKFEVLSKIDMGERIIASPVPVANRLLLRGEKHIFCVGAK